MTKRVGKSLRRTVAERARGLCEYCCCPDTLDGGPFGCAPHSVDHIVPTSLGGPNSSENLAHSCQGCNNLKSDQTEALDPESDEIIPLFHPRLQKWSDHFEWTADFLFLVGRTTAGRATIVALELNREGVVKLRRVLRRLRKHPPSAPNE